MDPAAVAARREAERWIGVAEKLLMARDLEGCKQFASQALDADPRAPGADDLLAAADALLAAQRRRLPSGHPDPYAVLGLDPSAPGSRDPDVIHAHYRRLALLLNHSHPDRPCSPAVADAARLVDDSWAFLSDPSRKSSLDADLDDAAAEAEAEAEAAAAAAQTRFPPFPLQEQAQASPLRRAAQQPARAAARPQQHAPPPVAAQTQQSATTFWTACPACSHVHLYDRYFEARTLLCPSCRRPFFSAAMPAPPPVVPGTDMYYCSWGFFPLGFPGGPGFAGMVNSAPPAAAAAFVTVAGGARSSTPRTAPVSRPVQSKDSSGPRKRGRPKGSKNKKNVVIDINEED